MANEISLPAKTTTYKHLRETYMLIWFPARGVVVVRNVRIPTRSTGMAMVTDTGLAWLKLSGPRTKGLPEAEAAFDAMRMRGPEDTTEQAFFLERLSWHLAS